MKWRIRVKRQGTWWRAVSENPAKYVRWVLDKKDAGTVALESILEVRETPERIRYGGDDDEHIVHLRMKFPQDKVLRAGLDACLDELDIDLIEPLERKRK